MTDYCPSCRRHFTNGGACPDSWHDKYINPKPDPLNAVSLTLAFIALSVVFVILLLWMPTSP